MIKDDKGNLVWKPTLKQEKFLQVPLSVKESFYAGAVNAGKSDVLLMYPIVHGWHEHPLFKGLFFRRTMPELRMEIIPRAEHYFKQVGGKYNRSDNVFNFPSGAKYFMCHCEHEKDVHNYDSVQPNYAAFDELTSFTEWIYLYITVERVRVPDHLAAEGLPMIVRSGSNPGNIGHQFVYKRFIKPYPEGGKILVGKGGIKRVFIPATIDDNPYASKQYKQELDALPEAERKAKKLGDWTAYEGQVFDEFRDKQYPYEPDNAIHVIPRFDIPDWWPKVVAIDWGYNAMASIGFGAISPNRRLYVYRHLHYRRVKIEIWAPEVKYWIDKENIQDIIICHSANQDRGQEHTILQQINEALGRECELGVKDRVGGKSLLQEYIRWKPKKIPVEAMGIFDTELAAWILRNKGEKEHELYCRSFAPPEPEENLPKLQLFSDPDIALIGEAIKACVYAKSDKSGKKKEDVEEFDGDDPYDMIRMLIHKADKYFDESKEKSEQILKQQTIITQLNNTGDMTAFYRNMRRLEAENSQGLPMIARRSRYGSMVKRRF